MEHLFTDGGKNWVFSAFLFSKWEGVCDASAWLAWLHTPGQWCQGVAVLPPWLAAAPQHQRSQSRSTLARRIPPELATCLASRQPATDTDGQERWWPGHVTSPSSCHAAKPHKQRSQR